MNTERERRAGRSFEVSTTVVSPPEAVIDLLMDLERHAGLHPFLVSARVVGHGESHRGPWWDWQVVERPALGPLRYRLRFRARLTRTSPTSMESWVRVLPGCRLRSVTRAAASAPGTTRVAEVVDATAPFGLADYLARQARAAHAQTYERLAAALAETERPR